MHPGLGVASRIEMRFARGTGSALCGCLAIAAYARAGHAEQRTSLKFGLDYQTEADLSCPSEDELRSALTRQLEYDPFTRGESNPEYSVHIALARAGSGLVARIDWLDQKGVSEGGRRLTSETGDCAELARGVVFAVAVQIQLWASTANPPAQPGTDAPAPAQRPTALPPVSTPRPPARGDRASSADDALLLVGLGPGLGHGFAPSTALGLEIIGAVSKGRAWLGGGLSITATTTYDRADGTGFDGRTLSGWISPCVRTPPFGWCAAGMVGRLYVRGHGVDRALSPATTLAAAGGKVEVMWPALRNFGVVVHAEVLGTLTPRTVSLNYEAVWSTAPVFVGGGFDLAAIFR